MRVLTVIFYAGVVTVLAWAGIIWVVAHFIRKFW